MHNLSIKINKLKYNYKRLVNQITHKLEDMWLKMTFSFINSLILCDKQIFVQMHISLSTHFI